MKRRAGRRAVIEEPHVRHVEGPLHIDAEELKGRSLRGPETSDDVEPSEIVASRGEGKRGQDRHTYFRMQIEYVEREFPHPADLGPEGVFGLMRGPYFPRA